MHVLLINPNTSAHITARLAASAQQALAPGDELESITARDGPTVVRCAATLQQADTAALALAAAHLHSRHDALLLGISLDGAVPSLRRQHPGRLIVGMTEAALMTACLRVDRVGLLTLGPALLPLYRDRVHTLGLETRVVAYEAPESSAAFAPGEPAVSADVLPVLAAAVGRLQQGGAQAVVLAGAVLCGYADALRSACGCPMLDGMACAVAQARVLLAHAR
jgi:allantoin racemase